MTIIQIAILAIIQGLAELLPVSSSAHVIAVAKLMHLDPSSPQFTLLLVMLHTGTMFAVILYFWKAWKRAFFSSRATAIAFLRVVIIGTVVTLIVGFGIKKGVEHVMKHQHPALAAEAKTSPQAAKVEIEQLFAHLELLSIALGAAGVLILVSGVKTLQSPQTAREQITDKDAVVIGAVQSLCLPFRGFSRSGSTISVGLLVGLAKMRLEEYSFALAVALTPAAILWEGKRLLESRAGGGTPIGAHDFLPSLIGMVFSFLAGLVALKLLSRLLEGGKWWIFGIYCLVAAGGLFVMYSYGY